jgi:hypothetical protein
MASSTLNIFNVACLFYFEDSMQKIKYFKNIIYIDEFIFLRNYFLEKISSKIYILKKFNISKNNIIIRAKVIPYTIPLCLNS